MVSQLLGVGAGFRDFGVVRVRSAGWTQSGVIRGGAGGLLELAAGGVVGVGGLVVLEDVAVMQ